MSYRSPLLYLAGPDVFLPDPLENAVRLKTICAAYGAIGLFPMDTEIKPDTLLRMARDIRLANENMIQRCDAVIANMRPFRGPGMDGGTAYEIGYAKALGKPVVGYTRDLQTYAERVSGMLESYRDSNGILRDQEGLSIEEFALIDNLMMADSIDELATDFEVAVALAVNILSKSTNA